MNPDPLPGYVWLETRGKVLHISENQVEFTELTDSASGYHFHTAAWFRAPEVTLGVQKEVCMRFFSIQLLNLVTSSLLMAACSQPRSTAANRERADSVAVDKQAEERAIRGLEQRWRRALTAKDSTAIGRFYTEDGYYLPQGSDGYEGPKSVRARWVSEPPIELQREPKRIEVADAGDMAYEVGTYEVSWEEPKDRGRGPASGNCVTVWKNVGGQWKMAAYICNRGEEK